MFRCFLRGARPKRQRCQREHKGLRVPASTSGALLMNRSHVVSRSGSSQQTQWIAGARMGSAMAHVPRQGERTKCLGRRIVQSCRRSNGDAICVGQAVTTTAVGKSFLGRRCAATRLGLTAMSFGGKPCCLGGSGRSSTPSFFRYCQGGRNNRLKPYGYILPVSELTSRSARHQPQTPVAVQSWCQTDEQPITLLRREGGRARDIPPEFDAGG